MQSVSPSITEQIDSERIGLEGETITSSLHNEGGIRKSSQLHVKDH